MYLHEFTPKSVRSCARCHMPCAGRRWLTVSTFNGLNPCLSWSSSGSPHWRRQLYGALGHVPPSTRLPTIHFFMSIQSCTNSGIGLHDTGLSAYSFVTFIFVCHGLKLFSVRFVPLFAPNPGDATASPRASWWTFDCS